MASAPITAAPALAYRRRGALRVSSCCCGCTLKTGTIIIGVLQALGGAAIALSMMKNLTRAGDVTLISARNHGLSDQEVRHVNRFITELNVDPRALSAALLALGSLQLLLSIALIYGANNEDPRLLRPWLVYAAVTACLAAGAYVALALLTAILGLEGVGTNILIGLLPACGIVLYFILVVHSFYLQLVTERPGGRPGLGPAPADKAPLTLL